jgi:hypothetical protein
MSTSDQTEYLRAKYAERGMDSGARFMQDGFDRWAQSTEPARMGQVEKMPSEPMPMGRGGAMDVATAKKYLQEMQGKLKDQVEKIPSGKGMVNFGFGIEINVPDQIINAVKYAKKLAEFVKMVSKKLPEINRDIQENIIDQPGDYSPQTVADSKELLRLLQSLVGYVNVINSVLAYAEYIPTGSGRRRRKFHKVRFGGASTTLEKVNQWVQYVTKAASTLYNYVSWFGKKSKTLKDILSLDSLQPTGKQILDALKPIYDLLGLIGQGKDGLHCTCETKRGKAMVFPPRKPILLPMTQRVVEDKREKHIRDNARASGKGMENLINMDALNNMYLPNPQQQLDMSMVQNLPGNMMSNIGRQFGFGKPKTKEEKRNSEAIPFQQVTPQTFQAFQPVVPSGMGRKKSDRGAIVRQVMKEKRLSLPQASKYVKEHGLYK